MPMQDDRQLVALAQQGDPEAFAQLVRRHQKMVYNLALGKTGSHHDAEEVTQTAFLKAWQGIRSFQGKAAFSSWLYRLTANAAIDLLRRRRAPALSLDDPDLPPWPTGTPARRRSPWPPSAGGCCGRPSTACPRPSVPPWCCGRWRG